jgi:hypothetical protein
MLAFKLKPAGMGRVLFDGILSIVIALMIASAGRQARWDSSGRSSASCSCTAAVAHHDAVRCAPWARPRLTRQRIRLPRIASSDALHR